MGSQMGGAPQGQSFASQAQAGGMNRKGLIGAPGYGMPPTQGPSDGASGLAGAMSAQPQYDYGDNTDIGTGASDFDMGRTPVNLGAGGDPWAWTAGMQGSGLLSDGANNTRMNPGWAASLRQNPTLANAMNYMSSQRPGGGAGTVQQMGGMPQGAGAQTFGLGADPLAGGVSPLRDPNAGGGGPLPYDHAVDWSNPFGQAMANPPTGAPPQGGGYGGMVSDAPQYRSGQLTMPGAAPPGFLDRLTQPIREHPWQTLGRIGAGMALGPAAGFAANRLFNSYNRRRSGGGP